MTNNYHKAYIEILEIIKYMPKEEKEKIPKDIVEVITKNADLNYKYKINTNISFEKQELLDETKAILANFYRDYWATEDERRNIIKQENIERIKIDEEKKKKYNPDNLFKTKKNDNNVQSKEIKIYEEPKWYQKFAQLIKKFIKKYN